MRLRRLEECFGLGNLDWANPTDMGIELLRVNHVPCHDDQLATLLAASYHFLGNRMADIRLHRRDLRPGFRLRTIRQRKVLGDKWLGIAARLSITNYTSGKLENVLMCLNMPLRRL